MAGMWHEERLYIDGELVEAEGGKVYDNINPANEEVLGVAADASAYDIEQAIAAARRAFDETEWSTDVELRARCLRQLRDAMREHHDQLGDLIVAEVVAPRMLIEGPHLAAPREYLGWCADYEDHRASLKRTIAARSSTLGPVDTWAEVVDVASRPLSPQSVLSTSRSGVKQQDQV